jgi:hypothetical protein
VLGSSITNASPGAVVIELPPTASRSLAAYQLNKPTDELGGGA